MTTESVILDKFFQYIGSETDDQPDWAALLTMCRYSPVPYPENEADEKNSRERVHMAIGLGWILGYLSACSFDENKLPPILSDHLSRNDKEEEIEFLLKRLNDKLVELHGVKF